MNRTTLTVDVDGVTLSGTWLSPDDPAEKPLVVALHGGAYSSRYFDIPVGGHPSFVEFMAASGFPVVAFDRPGHGDSGALPNEENTFERHAEILAQAIAASEPAKDAAGVVLVGHSIGGMIALTIAAEATPFELIGVSCTGMGAKIPPGGPAEQLAGVAAGSGLEVLPLPPEQANGVMFGPEWTYDSGEQKQAEASYAPALTAELIAAPKWAAEKLPALAPKVTVPIHNALAEFDALWDCSPENVFAFAAQLTNAPSVDASVAWGTGHSLDHHHLGHALHLRQVAFVEECALRAAHGNVG